MQMHLICRDILLPNWIFRTEAFDVGIDRQGTADAPLSFCVKVFLFLGLSNPN